mgnify:CR=1 FL=1
MKLSAKSIKQRQLRQMKQKIRRYLMVCGLLLIALFGTAKKPIKVACVGNSVTFGYGFTNRETTCYPYVLQQLLGAHYEVKNFGHSGTTLFSEGHRPYIQQPEYQAALAFKADLVVIHLGLNDTDPRNWPNYNSHSTAIISNLSTAFARQTPK